MSFVLFKVGGNARCVLLLIMIVISVTFLPVYVNIKIFHTIHLAILYGAV